MKAHKTLLAIAIGLVASNANAAAFQLNETSASGLGRAFAGDAVIADDASVLARNPAAMALFSEKSLSVGATYVDPGVGIKGIDTPALSGSTPQDLDNEGVVPPAVIPSFYYINPVSEQFAWGASVNSNFGLASDYGSDYAAGTIGGTTDLMTINAALNGSYRINSKLSVGLGINAVYGDAMLDRYAGSNPLVPGGNDTSIMHMEGDELAFGWNAGLVYEVDDYNRFGLTYRSEVDLRFEGEYTTPIGSGPGYLDLTLPEVIEFSGYHQVTNSFAVHYSIMRTGWSSFETMEAIDSNSGEEVFGKDEYFDDTTRYALGITYLYSPDWTLRAGIAKDESASNEHKSMSIPDSDRFWYSAGATYRVSEHGTIDFGVSYIDGDKVTASESDELLPGDWTFSSEGDAWLGAVQYNHTF